MKMNFLEALNFGLKKIEFFNPYFPVFGLNMGKYGPEKLRILILFTQCVCLKSVIFDHQSRNKLDMPYSQS